MAELLERIINIFTNQLKDLPGKKAHEIMMPKPLIYHNSEIELKESGVMILMYPCKNRVYSILIKRTSKGIHGNQIGLPGGKKEPGEDLETTAKRETEEEIGIPASQIKVFGKLSNIIINVSAHIVFPFVGYVNFLPELKVDKNEVEYVITYDIENFIFNCNSKTKVLRYNDIERKIPYFQIEGEMVWGATAMILNEFKIILNTYINKNF